MRVGGRLVLSVQPGHAFGDVLGDSELVVGGEHDARLVDVLEQGNLLRVEDVHD